MPSEFRPYLPDVRRDLEAALESPVRNVSAAIQRMLEIHVPSLIAVAEHAAITIRRAEQAEAELDQWRNLFGTAELEVTRARLARLTAAESAIERARTLIVRWRKHASNFAVDADRAHARQLEEALGQPPAKEEEEDPNGP